MTHTLLLDDMPQLMEFSLYVAENMQANLHAMIRGASCLSKVVISDTVLYLAPESLLQTVINTPSLMHVRIVGDAFADMQQVSVPITHAFARSCRTLQLRGGSMFLR